MEQWWIIIADGRKSLSRPFALILNIIITNNKYVKIKNGARGCSGHEYVRPRTCCRLLHSLSTRYLRTRIIRTYSLIYILLYRKLRSTKRCQGYFNTANFHGVTRNKITMFTIPHCTRQTVASTVHLPTYLPTTY